MGLLDLEHGSRWLPVFCAFWAACTPPQAVDDPEPVATTPTETPTPSWSCPGGVEPVALGVVDDPSVQEASGLVSLGDRFWVHNDSGDTPRVMALDVAGSVVETLSLAVPNIDFEDAAGRGDTLLIGDIGDNLMARTQVAVHRVALDGTVETTVLRYPDGEGRDAEALVVDPRDDSVLVITKAFSGMSEVFSAPVQGDEETWDPVASLDVSQLGGDRLVTAADLHPGGRWLAVRTYTRIHLFERTDGESLQDALDKAPCSLPWEREGQGESIAWWGDDLVSLSEGTSQTLWHLPLGVP